MPMNNMLSFFMVRASVKVFINYSLALALLTHELEVSTLVGVIMSIGLN